MTTPLSITCPVCSRPLKELLAGPIQCSGCGGTFPQTLGIPDFRGPEHEDTEADRTIVRLLLAQFSTASFEELLSIRVENAPTYGDLIGHEVDYLRGEASRSRLMIDMFHRRLGDQFGSCGTHTALDMGCGTGTSLPILAEKYDTVVGLEPSLPELILAKKYLETNGVTNVQLVQAYGQKVPFLTNSFDYINALNVLEHVFTINPVMAEIHRTLRVGGQFAGDSRNRFDLFTPEPHVKLRWVGLLPRKWAPAYVRLRRGVGYESTYLLSYRELKRGLRSNFGPHQRIVFPAVKAYGFPASLDPWINLLDKIPIFKTMGLWVFPSHLALAMKNGLEAARA